MSDPAFDHPSKCQSCQTYDSGHHRDCPENPAVLARTKAAVTARAAAVYGRADGDLAPTRIPDWSDKPGAIHKGIQPTCLHEREVLFVPTDMSLEAFRRLGGIVPETEADWRTDAAARKERPIATGVLDYFPDALAEVARVSKAGNDQHGTTGWDRSVSTDEANTLIRHFVERGTIDTDGQRHTAKVAWRALAMLQKELEAARNEEK